MSDSVKERIEKLKGKIEEKIKSHTRENGQKFNPKKVEDEQPNEKDAPTLVNYHVYFNTLEEKNEYRKKYFESDSEDVKALGKQKEYNLTPELYVK